MLLMTMPGVTEWIIIFLVLGIIIGLPVFLIVRLINTRNKNRQLLLQQQMIMLNSNKSDSVLSELEKLNNLKEKGLITKEEFEAQKKKILNS